MHRPRLTLLWLRDAWNPLHPRFLYVGPHALLIALAVGIAYLAGFFSGAAVTASYYRHHYQAPLPVPRQHTRVSVRIGSLPATGGIHVGYFTTAINDQGPLGSCQSWAFTKELSYALNWNAQPNGQHFHRFFSPRFAYDVVSQGADAGSYLEQYAPIVRQIGDPQWSQMPYGGAAGYPLDNPVPSWAYTDAAGHHFSLSETTLFQNPGAGMGGVALIDQALSTHHAVNLDLEVFPEYDQANADGSTVVPPAAGASSRGGHANVAVSYDIGHRNPDGTLGAILASNQWGNQAGVARDGIRHTDGTPNGYVWLADDFVAQDVWGASIIHVAGSSTGLTGVGTLPPHFGPADGGRPPAVKAHAAPPTGSTGAALWYVKPVYDAYSGQNLTPIFDAAGSYYHLPPIFLAAVSRQESAWNSHAERWAIYPDWSCGLMQVITANIAAYEGITDARAACNWEENPTNAIWLGAAMLRSMQNASGLGYPQLWGCYNAGSSCQSPYMASMWSTWDDVVANYAADGPPPTPKPKPSKPFNYGLWCHWSRTHSKPCPSPSIPHHRYHLTWPASIFYRHGTVGSFQSAAWYGRTPVRHHGFDVYHYSQGTAWAWPDFHRAQIDTLSHSEGE